MKTINTISFVKVDEGRITVFRSALDKQWFLHTHTDYELIDDGNAAVEPLYILVDTEGSGFVLTPRSGVTYNEAFDVIKHYL